MTRSSASTTPTALRFALRACQLVPDFGPCRTIEALPPTAPLLPPEVQHGAPPSVGSLEDCAFVSATSGASRFSHRRPLRLRPEFAGVAFTLAASVPAHFDLLDLTVFAFLTLPSQPVTVSAAVPTRFAMTRTLHPV